MAKQQPQQAPRQRRRRLSRGRNRVKRKEKHVKTEQAAAGSSGTTRQRQRKRGRSLEEEEEEEESSATTGAGGGAGAAALEPSLKRARRPAVGKASPTMTAKAAKAVKPLSSLQQRFQRKLQGGQFRYLNEKLYTTDGHSSFTTFSNNPALFHAVMLAVACGLAPPCPQSRAKHCDSLTRTGLTTTTTKAVSQGLS